MSELCTMQLPARAKGGSPSAGAGAAKASAARHGIFLLLLVAGVAACSRTSNVAAPLSDEQEAQLVEAETMLQRVADGALPRSEVYAVVDMLERLEKQSAPSAVLNVRLGQNYYYCHQNEGSEPSQDRRLGERAEQLLRQAVDSSELQPDQLEYWTAREMLGRIHHDRGELAEAEALLAEAARGVEELTARDEDLYNGCPYQGLGRLYADLGRYDDARDALRRAADLEPVKFHPQIEAAEGAARTGNLETAVTYTLRAWAAATDDRQTAWARAVLGLSDRLRALAAARGVDMPGWLVAPLLDFVARNARDESAADADAPGAAYTAARVAEVAAQLVERFLDNDFGVVANVASTLLAIPAETNFGQWRIRSRELLTVLEAYVHLVREDYDTAARQLGALRDEPRWAQAAAVGLGHAAIARKDYEEATRLLMPAVETGDGRLQTGEGGAALSPAEWLTYRMACLGMAWTQANQNRNAEALVYYRRILDRRPDDIFALLGAGNSMVALGKSDEAETYFQSVLERDARNPFALAELGLVHYNRGQHAEAERAFKMALEVDSERYTCPYEGLGLVYLKQGRKKEARQSLEKAIRIEPDIEYKKYNALARIHIEDGRYDEARRLLQKSIENFPYDDEARRMLAELPE